MIKPLQFRSAERHTSTAGFISCSRSGLKCGSSAKPSNNRISIESGASSAAASSRAVLVDLVLRLPDSANTFIQYQPEFRHRFSELLRKFTCARLLGKHLA